MSDHASSNNPDKNVSNINPPDEDPNTNIWGENLLKSLTVCKTADPHHQGTDGEGPLMCDYPDTDEDSLTNSPERLQKAGYYPDTILSNLFSHEFVILIRSCPCC